MYSRRDGSPVVRLRDPAALASASVSVPRSVSDTLRMTTGSFVGNPAGVTSIPATNPSVMKDPEVRAYPVAVADNDSEPVVATDNVANRARIARTASVLFNTSFL